MGVASKNLNIVIPVYNEESRIDNSFEEILNFYNSKLFDEFEIIFVSDGSIDNTNKKISDFINNNKNINCQLVGYDQNRGKGYAVKTGVMMAKMDYILMADADMSTPLVEIEKFISHINSDSEIIIGSRKLDTSNLIKPQGWFRRWIGYVYVLCSRLTSGLKNISDFGCGFKVFKTDTAQKVFSHIKTNGWVFDVEMLYLFNKAGIEIKQIGVKWQNNENSKLNFFKDFKKIFIDLIKIRLIHSNLRDKFKKDKR